VQNLAAADDPRPIYKRHKFVPWQSRHLASLSEDFAFLNDRKAQWLLGCFELPKTPQKTMSETIVTYEVSQGH
jgi:hypothetical protein